MYDLIDYMYISLMIEYIWSYNSNINKKILNYDCEIVVLPIYEFYEIATTLTKN